MDAFGEIGVFVRVVEKRSFTRAGEAVGMTASGVSRVLSRLEARLGVRLLERTTRSIGLTADGAAYYEQCTRILRELEDAHAALASSRTTVRGRLRVDAPTVLGRYVIAPAIGRFLDDHSELALDLSIRDHVIDPIAEGIDVVLRMAPLRESELVHKKLGTMRLLVVASPRYLARYGRPRTPAELQKHTTLGFLAGSAPLPWRFRIQGRDLSFAPTGRLTTNSIDALCHATLAGHGVAQVAETHIRGELADGTLEILLPDHERPPLEVHALYTRDKAALPKVRAFLDFMEQALAFEKGADAPKRATRRRR